jgi:hypothetical protein
MAARSPDRSAPRWGRGRATMTRRKAEVTRCGLQYRLRHHVVLPADRVQGLENSEVVRGGRPTQALLPHRRELRDARGMSCHLVFRGGKRNGAMDAIHFHGKGRSCIKLIGQHPLNQLSSLAAALGPSTQGRHLHAAFLPIEMKPELATLDQSLLSPSDGKVPIRLLECAVFDRIRP